MGAPAREVLPAVWRRSCLPVRAPLPQDAWAIAVAMHEVQLTSYTLRPSLHSSESRTDICLTRPLAGDMLPLGTRRRAVDPRAIWGS